MQAFKTDSLYPLNASVTGDALSTQVINVADAVI